MIAYSETKQYTGQEANQPHMICFMVTMLIPEIFNCLIRQTDEG
jgi:hypothetical protein